jgi:hypothetical protein
VDETTEVDDLLALAVKAAHAYGRPDLAARVEATARRRRSSETVVLVVGEFKQGKSSLVNAVLGIDVCPVDDDLATAVPTAVHHGHPPAAHACVGDEDGEERRVPVSLDAIAGWTTENGDRPAVRRVDVALPSPLLEDGLVLVDTPGAGGLTSAHLAGTRAALMFADGVLFVSDASAELTETELKLLREAASRCSRVALVESKIDLHPSWRVIAELDRVHARAAGIEVVVVPFSARLRGLAMTHDDDALDDESGAPALLDWLLDDVMPATHAVATEPAAVVLDVVAQLQEQFEAERRALVDERADTLQDVHAAAEAAQKLASRWPQTLADAFADFASDVDFDLRERMRALASTGDDTIDRIDPANSWGEYERWLYAATADAIAEHCNWRHERLATCVARVAETFSAPAAVPVEIALGADQAAEATGRANARLEVRAPGVAAQGLTLLRSSYGGLAMFGFLGGLTGLVISAPVMIGIGLVLGGKGVKEERARQIAQRRGQAKVSARKYLDEVSFVLSKENRDSVRRIQRELRDHFANRASELQRTTTAALAAAREANRADAAQRAARQADVEAELRRIDRLAARAEALLGDER